MAKAVAGTHPSVPTAIGNRIISQLRQWPTLGTKVGGRDLVWMGDDDFEGMPEDPDTDPQVILLQVGVGGMTEPVTSRTPAHRLRQGFSIIATGPEMNPVLVNAINEACLDALSALGYTLGLGGPPNGVYQWQLSWRDALDLQVIDVPGIRGEGNRVRFQRMSSIDVWYQRGGLNTRPTA
jgi:hypothetical protein